MGPILSEGEAIGSAFQPNVKEEQKNAGALFSIEEFEVPEQELFAKLEELEKFNKMPVKEAVEKLSTLYHDKTIRNWNSSEPTQFYENFQKLVLYSKAKTLLDKQ